MDASIRLRTGAGGALTIAPPARRTVTLRGPQAAGVASMRKAILDCAHQATAAEPVDTDRRLHSFIVKLSGAMELLGERELDAVLWNLMETKASRQLTPDEQAGIDWWNDLTNERRAHWLSVARPPTVAGAWAAFRAAEDDLVLEGQS